MMDTGIQGDPDRADDPDAGANGSEVEAATPREVDAVETVTALETTPESAETDAEAAAAAEADAAETEAEPGAETPDPEAEAKRAEERAAEAAAALEREADRVRALFTRSPESIELVGGDTFRFARWTRPIVPAFFGLAPDSAEVMAGAFKEAAELAGLETADEDPELGANILVFVVENWADLRHVPHLDRLTPDLEKLTVNLQLAGANQYRTFTFGPEGGVRLCVVMLRYDAELSQLSAASLALGQAVQSLLLWSDLAFADESPVTVRRGGKPLVKSRFLRLLKAAYDPETPDYSEDPALALALAEKMKSRRGGERGERGERDEGDRPRERGRGRSRSRARGGRRRDSDAAEDGTEAESGAPASADAEGDEIAETRERRPRRRRRPKDAEAEGGVERKGDPLGGDPREGSAAGDGGDLNDAP